MLPGMAVSVWTPSVTTPPPVTVPKPSSTLKAFTSHIVVVVGSPP